MKKTLACIIVLIALAFALPARSGQPAQTPEAFVSEFYAWYLKASEDQNEKPASKKEILKYVSKETAEYALTFPDGLEFFLRFDMGNLGPAREVKIITPVAIPMDGGIFVVPVTFKGPGTSWDPDWHVVAFVKKRGNAFSIVSINDIFPYL